MGKPSYRQVLVGRVPAGMQGLDEMFAGLYKQGRRPGEEGLGTELVERAQAHNYIPKPAMDDYAQALLREYRKYAEQRLCGCKPQSVDYGTWRGYPREHIPWFPTVATDLCDECGACLKFCRFGVFASGPDDKVEVIEPLKCVVGCSSCATLCKPKAITFPPRTILDAFPPVG